MPELSDLPPLALAAERLIAGRRTIHRFDARPVPPEVLRRAVALATRAPNHKHTEPWRFVVFTGAARERLVELNADIVRAKSGDAAADDKRARWSEVPAYLVATCRRSDDALREREDRDATAAALQNFALALWAEGVGAKWTTGPVTRDDRFLALAGVDPKAEAVVGLFMIGYPADVPAAPKRGGVDAVLTFLD